jgi:hypothetical protein
MALALIKAGLAYRGTCYFDVIKNRIISGEVIHWSAQRGYVALAHHILQDEDDIRDIHVINEHGSNAIQISCCFGHDVLLKVLLADRRINPHMLCSLGKSSLLYAIATNNARCMEALFEDCKIDVNDILPGSGFRAIDIICTGRRVELLKAILKNPKVKINDLLPGVNSSITWVAMSVKYHEIAELLITDERVELNHVHQRWGCTMFHNAIKISDLVGLNFLLAHERVDVYK